MPRQRLPRRAPRWHFSLPFLWAQDRRRRVSGTAVLSDLANEQGPLLVQTLDGARRLGVSVDQSAISKPIPPQNVPHLSVLETQAAPPRCRRRPG